MLYDIIAERACCPTRVFARGVTLVAAAEQIESAYCGEGPADGRESFEGYEFIAKPRESGSLDDTLYYEGSWVQIYFSARTRTGDF